MRPYLDILRLVWPLALGMINNAVMQFVDRAYLAHDSMASLEAVLPASMLSWIFLSFFQSVVGYAGVFVAQYHGAGDEGKCVTSYRSAMAIALMSGVLMLPLQPLGDWVLALAANTPELVARERAYYDIVILGGFFVYGQMAAAAYFTGRGRTRLVFWVNLAGNLINIALDPLLIFGWCGLPALGIAGAAYATVLSMAVQWVTLTFAVHRAIAGVRAPLFDRSLAWRILRFGVPAGGYSVLNILSFTIFVFVTGHVGDLAFAVSNACFTINYLLFAPMEGFALGAQTLVGQAMGRGDAREAAVAMRRTLILALGFVAAFGAVALLLSRPILMLFASPVAATQAEFLALGFRLLMLMAAWMVFDAADVVLAGALKGAGDTKFVFWWMFLCAFVLWLPMVFAVRRIDNSMPVLWATMIVYVVVTCIGSFWRWGRGHWREIDITQRRQK